MSLADDFGNESIKVGADAAESANGSMQLMGREISGLADRGQTIDAGGSGPPPNETSPEDNRKGLDYSCASRQNHTGTDPDSRGRYNGRNTVYSGQHRPAEIHRIGNRIS